MTPQEKLEEIKNRRDGQIARCIGGSFSAIQQARYEFSENAVLDINWLIARVEQLEILCKQTIDQLESPVMGPCDEKKIAYWKISLTGPSKE